MVLLCKNDESYYCDFDICNIGYRISVSILLHPATCKQFLAIDERMGVHRGDCCRWRDEKLVPPSGSVRPRFEYWSCQYGDFAERRGAAGRPAGQRHWVAAVLRRGRRLGALDTCLTPWSGHGQSAPAQPAGNVAQHGRVGVALDCGANAVVRAGPGRGAGGAGGRHGAAWWWAALAAVACGDADRMGACPAGGWQCGHGLAYRAGAVAGGDCVAVGVAMRRAAPVAACCGPTCST